MKTSNIYVITKLGTLILLGSSVLSIIITSFLILLLVIDLTAALSVVHHLHRTPPASTIQCQRTICGSLQYLGNQPLSLGCPAPSSTSPYSQCFFHLETVVTSFASRGPYLVTRTAWPGWTGTRGSSVQGGWQQTDSPCETGSQEPE